MNLRFVEAFVRRSLHSSKTFTGRRLDDVPDSGRDRLLAGQGLKLLHAAPRSPQSLSSVEPVQSLADLKGTRMRAYNPATSKIAKLLGAQPVTVQMAGLSLAVAKGADNNFLTSSPSGVLSKLHKHVKHFYAIAAVAAPRAEGLTRELRTANDKMPADWLQAAGVDGKVVVDSFRR